MWYAVRGEATDWDTRNPRTGSNGSGRTRGPASSRRARAGIREMLCYPFVFDHAGRRYLLYNGNDYGRTGIGLAEEEG